MSLNANLIKELREKSGACIVDCKNALLQNDNDVNIYFRKILIFVRM